MNMGIIICCIVIFAVLIGLVIKNLYEAKNLLAEQDELMRSLDRGLGESVKDISDEMCSNTSKYSIGYWTNEQKMECLERQRLVCGLSKSKLREMAKFGVIKIYDRDSIISEQGDDPKHAFFIFDGKVDVIINGSKVAERTATDCVGEIPLLHKAWRRNGTLKTSQRSVIFELSYDYLMPYLKSAKSQNPFVTNLALILAERLRERGRFLRQPNNKPKVFIGSSTKTVEVAKKVKKELSADKGLEVIIWTDGVFKPSLTSIESLEKFAAECDFAIIIFGPDDKLVLDGGGKVQVPRDNVIFELGLFMGVLGRERTFFMADKGKRPTDLDGVTYEKYTFGKGKKLDISEAVKKIRDVINDKKVR